jgi:hypothetical protein
MGEIKNKKTKIKKDIENRWWVQDCVIPYTEKISI